MYKTRGEKNTDSEIHAAQAKTHLTPLYFMPLRRQEISYQYKVQIKQIRSSNRRFLFVSKGPTFFLVKLLTGANSNSLGQNRNC